MADYTEFKEILIKEKEKLTKSITETKELQKSGSDELSQYDNHPADTASELTERATVAAINAKREETLLNVEEALKALEDGTYGICKECGVEIPYERLEIIPETLYCVEHVPKRHTSHARPVEEAVLDEIHSIERDDIDSFAAVASFGTSESPSDFTESVNHYAELYNSEEENHLDD